MTDTFSKSDKNFGLPEVELVPIDRGQPGVAKAPVVTPRKNPPKKENRYLPILVFVTVSLLVLALLYYLFWGSSSSEPHETLTQTTQEQTTDEDQSNGAEEVADVTDAETVIEAENSGNEDVIAEEPGSIVTISERTDRYYIFLGSYKFKAYARRHAERLAADGFAVKLITPDNWVGMRVAVGNYASMGEASDDAAFIKDKYGNEVVVSKY